MPAIGDGPTLHFANNFGVETTTLLEEDHFVDFNPRPTSRGVGEWFRRLINTRKSALASTDADYYNIVHTQLGTGKMSSQVS